MIVVCAFGVQYLDEFFEYYNKYNRPHQVLVIQNDVNCKGKASPGNLVRTDCKLFEKVRSARK